MKTLISPKSLLRAKVVEEAADKVRYGQAVVTSIGIWADKTLIAVKKISGRYNVQQALAEFHRNPRSFKRTEAYAAAINLGLVKA